MRVIPEPAFISTFQERSQQPKHPVNQTHSPPAPGTLVCVDHPENQPPRQRLKPLLAAEELEERKLNCVTSLGFELGFENPAFHCHAGDASGANSLWETDALTEACSLNQQEMPKVLRLDTR